MDDAIKPTTETDRPNLSTEHQRDGDARRPSDTLDREQTDKTGEHSDDRAPASGQKQEKVTDRPNVSTVEPEDYPRSERAGGPGGVTDA